MLEHLVMIGIDFNPARATGDKNFWLELLKHVAPGLKRVTVLSLKKTAMPVSETEIGGCRVVIRYIATGLLDSPGATGWMVTRRLGAIEKALKAGRLLGELDALWKEEPYQHIHLMDNLGLANRIIAGNAASRVSVTAFTYQGAWPNLVYDWFLRASYSHPNITVVTFCDAYREKLAGIGVAPGSVCRIPWGVSTEGGGAGREPGLRPLVLWAGYICPIGKRDFLFAYDTARKALEDGLKAEFVFALKPECHEARFARLDRPDEGISVVSTSEAQFAALKSRADVFYSPVITRDVIVGPPLTWIEMLACGVPVVTTDVEGVSEVVTDGVTGYVAAGEDDVVDRLKDAVRTYGSIKDRCMARVRDRYDITDSADRYLALWRVLASRTAEEEGVRQMLKPASAGVEACALKVKGP